MSETARFEKIKMGGDWWWWEVSGELRDTPFPTDKKKVTFQRARLLNVDFSGLTFDTFSACDSVFVGCDFSATAFDYMSLGATGAGSTPWDRRRWRQTTYRGCTFRRTRFAPYPFFGNARFEGCRFDRARLRKLISTQEAEFVDCVFRGPMREVNFWGRPCGSDHKVLGRDRNEFHGNDFTAADLDGVAFNHIDLRAQRFPGAPGYALLDHVSQRVAAALAVVDAWADDDMKGEARFALEFIATKAREYNDDMALVSRKATRLGRKLPPDMRAEVFALLTSYSDDQQ